VLRYKPSLGGIGSGRDDSPAASFKQQEYPNDQTRQENYGQLPSEFFHSFLSGKATPFFKEVALDFWD